MIPHVGMELQGRYELMERLAIGGMGEVWRATDLRSGRAVAAKILRPELTGDEIFLSRLRAEATNSRGLRHPNLAVVLDAGERDGSGWIIMELVQGRALSDILAEQGTMPPAEILPILAQVARALQVVHDAGVVHRDVKPSNILINREGLAKLTDFGISTGAHQRPLTATGMVMGTAQYLSPEQAMGNMARPAGDLYALGVIAYEALVGHRPFTGATQVDIAFAHVNQPVPPLPKEIHPEVREIVMELLAKDPAARPHSARELARRLDRIVIHLPRESWDPEQPPSWQRRSLPTPSLTSQGVPHPGGAAAAAGGSGAGTASLPAAGSLPATTLAPHHPGAPGSRPGVRPGVRPGTKLRDAVRDREARGLWGMRPPRPPRQPVTAALPAVDRTRAVAARAARLPAGVHAPRHDSGRRQFGLPQAMWNLVVTVVTAALVLLLTLGTLALAQPAAEASALHAVTNPKEAL